MEIADPQFEIGSIVEPTPDAAIKPASRVGRVESRAWTEFRDQPGYWRYTIRWPAGGTSSEGDKHLRISDTIDCDLKVVVSGVPVKIDTTTTATVDELIEQAILKAGAATHPSIGWELRTESGRRLVRLVGDAEPVDGETTLFLDPEVGGGADEEPTAAEEAGQVWPKGSPERRLIERGGKDAVMRDLAEGAGWKGTPPAEGTRRALIRDAVRSVGGVNVGPGGPDAAALRIADAVESALLQSTIDDEAMARGAEALTAGIESVEPDAEPDVTITASDGASLGGLEVVIGAQDGVPYVSLADLEHVFANLYEDITERQALADRRPRARLLHLPRHRPRDRGSRGASLVSPYLWVLGYGVVLGGSVLYIVHLFAEVLL